MTQHKQLRQGLLFASPFLVGFVTFTIYPVAMSLYYSLCDYNVIEPPRFNGGAHYTELWQDELFRKSLANTVYFTVFAVP